MTSTSETGSGIKSDPSATEQLIKLFGGIRPMATKLKIPVTTVQGWKKRQAIPANRHEEIAAGATKLEIELPADLLASTAPDEAADTAKKTKTASAAVSTTDKTASSSDKTDAAAKTDTKASSKDASPAKDDDPAKARQAADEQNPSAIDRAREVKERAAASRGETAARPADGSGTASTASTSNTAAPAKVRVVGSKRASLAVLMSFAALGAIATQPLWVNDLYSLWQKPAPGGNPSDRLNSMDTALTELTQDVIRLSGRGEGVQVEQLQQVIARIDQDIQQLEQSLAQGVASSGTGVTSTAPTANPQAIERLRRDIGRDLEPLASNIQDLNDRLDALEATDQAGVPARQVNTVLAAGTLLSAVRGSSPFPAELSALIRLGPSDPAIGGAITTLEAHANSGVPTAQQLADSLADNAGAALKAIHMDEDASLLDRTLGQLQGLVTVRRAPGQVEGDDPAALLARAEDSLRAGNVRAALDLVGRLPTPATEALATWRGEAEARLDVEEASRIILSRATDLALAEGAGR
ncbi:MAG: hypothetical protein KI792_00590 [Alphaproteobacteria bacterium]|nr:hypothetical protein [Alphaproteobacteria bacterium SS10]